MLTGSKVHVDMEKGEGIEDRNDRTWCWITCES